MKHPIFVPEFGEYQVYNALAAIAAVHDLGIGIKEAGEVHGVFHRGLRSFKCLKEL